MKPSVLKNHRYGGVEVYHHQLLHSIRVDRMSFTQVKKLLDIIIKFVATDSSLACGTLSSNDWAYCLGQLEQWLESEAEDYHEKLKQLQCQALYYQDPDSCHDLGLGDPSGKDFSNPQNIKVIPRYKQAPLIERLNRRLQYDAARPSKRRVKRKQITDTTGLVEVNHGHGAPALKADTDCGLFHFPQEEPSHTHMMDGVGAPYGFHAATSSLTAPPPTLQMRASGQLSAHPPLALGDMGLQDPYNVGTFGSSRALSLADSGYGSPGTPTPWTLPTYNMAPVNQWMSNLPSHWSNPANEGISITGGGNGVEDEGDIDLGESEDFSLYHR